MNHTCLVGCADQGVGRRQLGSSRSLVSRGGSSAVFVLFKVAVWLKLLASQIRPLSACEMIKELVGGSRLSIHLQDIHDALMFLEVGLHQEALKLFVLFK